MERWRSPGVSGSPAFPWERRVCSQSRYWQGHGMLCVCVREREGAEAINAFQHLPFVRVTALTVTQNLPRVFCVLPCLACSTASLILSLLSFFPLCALYIDCEFLSTSLASFASKRIHSKEFNFVEYEFTPRESVFFSIRRNQFRSFCAFHCKRNTICQSKFSFQD